MTAVQFDDIDQTYMCINVFSVVVCQKSFLNIVDQFHKGYDGRLLLFYYAKVPCLNYNGLQLKLTLGDDLLVLLREVLEILSLLRSFFNSHIQFNLGGLGNVLVVGLQFC